MSRAENVNEWDEEWDDIDPGNLPEEEDVIPPNPDGSINVSQMTLVCGLMAHIVKHHGKKISLHSRQMNSLITAANLIVEEFGKPIVKASPGMGMAAWLASDDTGLSSLAMVNHITKSGFWAGVRLDGAIALARENWKSHPSDPEDFGRCLRLLEAVPELVEHLPLMSSLSPTWAAYVARWDEMVALYKEEYPTGSAPKLYDLMQSIQEEVRKSCEQKPSDT